MEDPATLVILARLDQPGLRENRARLEGQATKDLPVRMANLSPKVRLDLLAGLEIRKCRLHYI